MKIKSIIFIFVLLLIIPFLNSCNSINLINATSERVTFDIVFETQEWLGKKVYGYLYDNYNNQENSFTGLIEILQGTIDIFPNTTHSHVELTTLNEIPTNEAYFIDIYIDLNNNGKKDEGDYTGIIYVEVRAGFNRAEYHCFTSDLTEF